VLFEFVTLNHDALVAKARDKITTRPWPPASALEIENGVPLFLTQLTEALKRQSSPAPFSSTDIGIAATQHGRDLFEQGFTVSQVVHDYGAICQAVTELADEQDVPIAASEFQTLNGCLDAAIADAVTEHARITAAGAPVDELERMGHLMHELRNNLNTALMAFDILKRGAVGVSGSTGAVLGRSLISMQTFVDSSLAEIRTAASHHRPEIVAIPDFIGDIVVAARLHADYSDLTLRIDPIDPDLRAKVDAQLLESALMNLFTNAFKYTRKGGSVTLGARAEDGKLLIEVQDQCGGIPEANGDPFEPFGDRRGKDRTGLGLGLSIARKAVRAQNGDVTLRNIPGTGCIFTIDVPLATFESVPAAVRLP
jgi:signal transduction histidine kinase